MDTNPTTDPGFVKPFRASWIDHLVELIERLPVPTWVFYLFVLLLFAFLNNAIVWVGGFGAPGTIIPLFTFAAVYVIYGIGFYHYLNIVAVKSLHDIYPLLSDESRREEILKYQLTHLPAGWGWLALILGCFGGVFDAVSSQAQMELNSTTVTTFTSIIGTFNYATLFALMFRTARQLQLVVNLHHRVLDIDLFNLSPLRAFSRLTAVAGFSIFFLGAFSALIYMEDSDPSLLALYIFILIAGVLVFIIPLLSLRNRISKEKKQKLFEADQRTKFTLKEVKHALANGDLSGMSDFNTTLSVLEKEKTILKGISSFPWNPGTLKSFISTILIPILIWLIRTVLEKWV